MRRAFGNVLVVDDDERLLGSWRRNIGKDRVVATASDATTALALAQTQPPDLAIVDLRLGAANGLDLVRSLKQEMPKIVVVLYSGYLSVAITVAAMRAGCDFVVFKPVTFKDILNLIEGDPDPPDLGDTPTLARAQWEHITRVLTDCNGNVSRAARRLGLQRSSLQRRLRKYAPRS